MKREWEGSVGILARVLGGKRGVGLFHNFELLKLKQVLAMRPADVFELLVEVGFGG